MTMQWIGGSDYQYKLEMFIDEMLKSHQQVVFFVDEQHIVDYERRLLDKSASKGYLHIQVTTMERYCYQVLKKNRLFKYQPIQDINLHMLVKESLQQLELSVLKDSIKNSQMIKSIIQALKQIDEYQISHTTSKYLVGFSKDKIEDLINIYQYVIQHKSKYDLFHTEIYRIAKPYFDQEISYYCDGVEKINVAQKELLDSLSNGKVALTTYQSQNQKTNQYQQLYDYQAGFKKHLSIHFDTKQPLTQTNQHYRFFKATHKKQEVEEVAYSIYHQLVEEKLRYQNFLIYVTDSSYLDIIEEVFLDFNLPVNLALHCSYQHYPIYQFLKLFFDYATTKDIKYFGRMLYSECFDGLFDRSYIDYINHCINQKIEISDDNVIKAKLIVDDKVETFSHCCTASQFSNLLYSWFVEKPFRNSMIQYPNAYTSLLSYIEKYASVEVAISKEDYIDIFTSYYNDSQQVEYGNDCIEVNLLYNESSMVLEPKYLYILGCCEQNFPKEISNKGLLLEEEKEQLKIINLSISLAREENQLFYTIIFKAIVQADNVCLSYSTGSYQGDQFLASLLYQHIQLITNQKESLFVVESDKIASQKQFRKRALLNANLDVSNLNDQDFYKAKRIIDDYQQQKNRPIALSKPQIKALYQKSDGKLYTSSSQLETFNGCPYRHYLTYGLQVYPLKQQVIEISDIGTLQHALVEKLTPLYQSKKQTENRAVLDQMLEERTLIKTTDTIQDIKALISDIIQKELDNNPKLLSKIENDVASSFIVQRMIDNSIQHLFVLLYHSSVGEFEVLATEKWVQKKVNHGIILSGKVDRVDLYQDYLKVVDYKSSNKSLDLALAIQGFNMQMLVYLDMLSTTLHKKKGAVVYFNLSKRNIKAKEKMSLKEETLENFIKEYKMQGYAINDSMHTVISGIDKDYSLGNSSIMNLRYVKSSNQYKGNLLSQQEMEELLNLINQRLDQLVENIFVEGDIAIMPSSHELSAIKMKVHPCRFCEYRSVCQKDVFYNQDRMIINYTSEEVKEKLRGDQHHGTD